MQINSVQNYHTQRPAFKSEVRLHHNDVISINSSLYWKDTIIDGIEQLQKNGNNDRAFIERYRGPCVLNLLIKVVKKEGEKLFVGSASSDSSESIEGIYKEAAKNMKPIEYNPLYFGLTKVHMLFDDINLAGQNQSWTKNIMDLEKAIKDGDSVSIEPCNDMWTSIWMDVIRKNGENYTYGWKCNDMFHRKSLTDVYNIATKNMEPQNVYNSNPLYFKL